jgi:hypothetical protein
MSTLTAARRCDPTIDAFQDDATRLGVFALTGSLLLAGLSRSGLADGPWADRAWASAAAAAALALFLLSTAALLAIATGSIKRNLALAGGAALAVAALAVTAVRSDGWSVTTASALFLLLALLLGSSPAIRPLSAVVIALRLLVLVSLGLIVIDPDAASSPLATRYFLRDFDYRFQGILNHPVALSYAGALLFTVALCLSYRRSVRALDAAAGIAAVFLSDTRSGTLAIGLAVVLRLALSVIRRQGWRPRLFLVAVPVGLVAAQLALTAWGAARSQSLLEQTSWRSRIWDWCWDAVGDRPLLGGNPEVFAGGGQAQVLWWHCHDQSLSTLYHVGVPGLLALCVLLAGLGQMSAARLSQGCVQPWISLCVVLAIGMFETPLGFLGDSQTAFLALVAVLLAASPGVLERRSSREWRVPPLLPEEHGPLPFFSSRESGWRA